MSYLTQIAALLAAVTLTSSSLVRTPSNDDGTFELLILHNNDMHARFEQTSQLSGTCTPKDRDAGKCYGGFPRVAHVVKEARRKAETGEGPPVLYLNAGDTYTGTAWFTIYKWKIAAEFINALQPDAVALGNNDVDHLTKRPSSLLQNIQTPILASNILLKSVENNIQKSIIFDVEGIKVGLVSYLTPSNELLDTTGEIEFLDEVLAVQNEVKKLQGQNVNIIIALGHASHDKDLEIAREVEGLDLVIAADRNSYYWNGTTIDKHQVERAVVIEQQSGRQVPIVQSTAYDKYLGKIQLRFNTDGELTSFNIKPVLLDTSISQDTKATQILTKYIAELTPKSQEIVGETAVVLDGESCKVEECNLGNLVTDAINYYYAINYRGERWTDAPVTIIPGGDIESSISPLNRPASVTMGDLIRAIPTEGNLVAVTMNGTILLNVLEHAVSSYSASRPTGQLLQFSGIRVVYDLSKERGSRVVSAVVRCWACFVPEFYAIDDWRDYRILMPAALADGAYGYKMLSEIKNKTSIDYDEVTCLAEYIGLRSPVYPEVAGRIRWQNYDAEPDSATIISSTLIVLFVSLIPIII